MVPEFTWMLCSALHCCPPFRTTWGQWWWGSGVKCLTSAPGGVQEEQAADTQTFRSTKEGQMHACGHDTHMAMLLGGMHPPRGLHAVRVIGLLCPWGNS